ncbi:MAG: SDR family NAD(P)-dependent oxidoreductase [Lachnospiraceae bacterium]|nr:SDR family NAD(P)-dependent oxidoreductase [Lachnospiraceae bacterium]
MNALGKGTAVITGASRGIGRAIAEKFAKEGFSLYLICEKNIDILNGLAAELKEKYGTEGHTFAVDVSNADEVRSFYNNVEALDVLINNAGISHIGLLQDMSIDGWNRVLSVNLTSCFNMCKGAIPILLKKKSGSIINISSVWGNVGASMEVAYSASKGGMNAFTKALAKELAPSSIAVNAIACGMIDTDMNRIYNNEETASIIEGIPAGRMGMPAEIAEVVYNVAISPSYLTGQIITADGGWT